jgi:thioredoxin reductase
MPLAPSAKRVLLTAYADTDAAIRAINQVRIHYYLTKPWDPPEQNLYPYLDDLLEDWQANYRPPYAGVRLVGTRWSPRAHALRDFLGRNLIPFQWLDVDASDDARVLAERLAREAGPERREPTLPAVLLPDGAPLLDPEPAAVAERLGLRMRAEKPFYDLVVVGAGPAGLAAAVYGASEGLHTLLVEREAPGGQAGTSSNIENYLGFPLGLTGADLTRRAVAQARKFGAEILTPQEVRNVRVDGPYRVLTLGDGTEVSTRVLLVSTGVSYRWLEAPGVAELTGRGVYYGAALTEALSCRDEDVYVVGGGNSAGQAAMYFARYARQVTILVRGPGLAETMSQYLIDQIAAMPNIVVQPRTQVAAVAGDGHLETIVLRCTDGSERVVRGRLAVRVHRRRAAHRLAGRDGRARPARLHPHWRLLPRTPGLAAERAAARARLARSTASRPCWRRASPGLLRRRCAAPVGEAGRQRGGRGVPIAVQFTHHYLAESDGGRSRGARALGAASTTARRTSWTRCSARPRSCRWLTGSCSSRTTTARTRCGAARRDARRQQGGGRPRDGRRPARAGRLPGRDLAAHRDGGRAPGAGARRGAARAHPRGGVLRGAALVRVGVPDGAAHDGRARAAHRAPAAAARAHGGVGHAGRRAGARAEQPGRGGGARDRRAARADAGRRSAGPAAGRAPVDGRGGRAAAAAGGRDAPRRPGGAPARSARPGRPRGSAVRWLSAHDVARGWELAPLLLDRGVTPARLEELSLGCGPGVLGDALAWAEQLTAIRQLLEEAGQSTARISEMVRAIKAYSYTDTTTSRRADVHEGIEQSLTMLTPKLRDARARIARAYDRSLPPSRASARSSTRCGPTCSTTPPTRWPRSAAGALRVVTRRGEDDGLVVDVTDAGPGIAPEAQGAYLRAVLHHQGAGQGHRPRARDRAAHRQPARRADRRRLRAGHTRVSVHLPVLLPLQAPLAPLATGATGDAVSPPPLAPLPEHRA